MLFEQIARNKRKTLLLMFIFFILLSAVGAAIGIIVWNNIICGLAIAAGIGILYILFMLWQGSAIVMWMNGGREVTDRAQAPTLFAAVEDMAMVAGIPTPRIFIIDESAPNAFATGTSPTSSAVAVTSGLITRLERYELEGVIAHEIAHIRNYDIRLATIAIALASAIGLLSELGYRAPLLRSRKSDSKNNANAILLLASIALIILAPFIATALRFALSRNREFLADATAVELTRNPEGLIAALEKIQHTPEKMVQVNRTSQSLWFTSPLHTTKAKAGWFDTHPPIATRIEQLKAM